MRRSKKEFIIRVTKRYRFFPDQLVQLWPGGTHTFAGTDLPLKIYQIVLAHTRVSKPLRFHFDLNKLQIVVIKIDTEYHPTFGEVLCNHHQPLLEVVGIKDPRDVLLSF